MPANISELLYERKLSELRMVVRELHYADIAEAISRLDEQPDMMLLLFRMLPKETAADVFSYLDAAEQESLISHFTDSELSFILGDMYLDDYVDLIEEMPANVVKRVLNNTTADNRRLVNQYLQYPQDSAGSLMTNEYVYLKKTHTVEDAIDSIRKTGVDKETINNCFVIDQRHRLEGSVSLRSLILAQPGTIISELLPKRCISVNAHDDQEHVAFLFAKYDVLSVPVVDNEERLVGIITIDDVMDVVVEEFTEDIELMAAITPSDKPYLKTSVIETWKSRVPWLLLLMLSATFTSMILNKFELALAGGLVAFIPMLMGTAGNSSSQSSVSIIRALSLNELSFKDVLSVLYKEFRVSILCGVTLSICGFLKLMFIDKIMFLNACVISLTLLFIVMLSQLIGSFLPLIAKRLGADPAVMASPLITTIVDAITLLIYSGVAIALI